MDPSYAMAKFGLESKDMFKSKQKGCWHYMKYFFIFSSIIQFLIILGLVLFMLYGNAHAGTELRLKSVENRYKNLTVDYALLKGNYSLLREKLVIAEKDMKNCSDTVMRTRLTMMNITRTGSCLRCPVSNCNNLQAVMDHLNMTCLTQKLKAENDKMLQVIQFNQYKDNCTKTTTEYTNKYRLISSENVQLQKNKKDLDAQINLLQKTCSGFDSKFSLEIQNLKIDAPVDTYDSYSKCKILIDTFNNRLDVTLNRLRHEVNNVAYENSQIRVTNARANEDLGQCNREKETVTQQRNILGAEKSSIEMQLNEKKDELNKSYSRYIKKEEELDNCRRLQMRPPIGFPPIRN